MLTRLITRSDLKEQLKGASCHLRGYPIWMVDLKRLALHVKRNGKCKKPPLSLPIDSTNSLHSFQTSRLKGHCHNLQDITEIIVGRVRACQKVVLPAFLYAPASSDHSNGSKGGVSGSLEETSPGESHTRSKQMKRLVLQRVCDRSAFRKQLMNSKTMALIMSIKIHPMDCCFVHV